MDKNRQLSILLPFQNERARVEPTLTALFELSSINFELFIIDDASSDGTAQAIQSLLDYYQHEHTFYFEHTKPAGRGNCLNELLPQINTGTVWAVQFLEDIDETLLKNAVNALQSSNNLALIQRFAIPDEEQQWPELVCNKDFPSDNQFLWHLANVPSAQQFLNPYLNRFHCFEWLLRLGSEKAKSYNNNFHYSSSGKNNPTAFERQEMAMALLRRADLSSDIHERIIGLLEELPEVSSQKTDAEHELEQLREALQLKEGGQLSLALENVERILKSEPGNRAAKKLKIEILERKRRFVEASELKHELGTEGKSKKVHGKLQAGSIKTSIIIPTALHGKPALENCLLSVGEHCNPATTELILIDNASLDDTFDYLKELKGKNFYNCKIITNHRNQGFATSVNQGFEAAEGKYFCVLHNDVEFNSPAIAQLEQLMDENPEYSLLGPLADSTLNPDQLISNKKESDEVLEETDFLDSFLMMIRASVNLKMDKKYTLAFFDDIDFSFQMRKAGHKVGIAAGVAVTHHYGNTTFALDLDTESELYWKNIAYFNEKWEVESFSEDQLLQKNELEQLLLLDEWVNPVHPQAAIKEKFNELFTSEMKTQILKSNHDRETLQRLVHLFMVMGERDTMRRLEDRLTKPELPVTLIYELVRFYFKKNIYSRCLHYLDRLTMQQQSLQSELYRLAILIDEKKMDKAIPKLNELLEKAPSNPLLYKLAGDIYTFQNDNEEAESFYKLAEQINPFNFSREEKTSTGA